MRIPFIFPVIEIMDSDCDENGSDSECDSERMSDEDFEPNSKQSNTGMNNDKKCPKCEYKFASSWHLKRHIAEVHEKQRVSCPKCHKTMNKRSLDRHLLKGSCLLYTSPSPRD